MKKIAAVLHETRYAETKGSGIRAMREAMSMENLRPPTFESDREKDNFVVTFLFHHFLNPDDIKWLGHFAELDLSEDEQKALVFAREISAINNAAYRDINRVETLVASGHLRKLRDLGLLDQKGRGAQTYYMPTNLMLHPLTATQENAVTNSPTPAITAQAQRLTPAPRAQAQGLDPLPAGLSEAIEGLGLRAALTTAKPIILRLCAWRPLRAEQIAHLLGRRRSHVMRSYLAPMIRNGELVYLYPDQPAHPQQAYKVPTKRSEK